MRWICGLVVLAGCPEAKGPPKGKDKGEEPSVTGAWEGDCSGSWIETSPPGQYDVTIPIVLDLTDEDGEVTGTFVIAVEDLDDPVEVTGTREDQEVELEAPETEEHLGYRFEMTLDDTLSGTWAAFSEVEAVQPALDCVLTR
jgi:hypothetical protein